VENEQAPEGRKKSQATTQAPQGTARLPLSLYSEFAAIRSRWWIGD